MFLKTFLLLQMINLNVLSWPHGLLQQWETLKVFLQMLFGTVYLFVLFLKIAVTETGEQI